MMMKVKYSNLLLMLLAILGKNRESLLINTAASFNSQVAIRQDLVDNDNCVTIIHAATVLYLCGHCE